MSSLDRLADRSVPWAVVHYGTRFCQAAGLHTYIHVSIPSNIEARPGFVRDRRTVIGVVETG